MSTDVSEQLDIELVLLEDTFNGGLVCNSPYEHDCLVKAEYSMVAVCMPGARWYWCAERYRSQYEEVQGHIRYRFGNRGHFFCGWCNTLVPDAHYNITPI